MSSLYKPSAMPYMVDTIDNRRKPATQYYTWYISLADTGLHLRHNRRANVWIPDGHVESWGISDGSWVKAPNNTGVPTLQLGYLY